MLLKLAYIGLTIGMLVILYLIGNYAINKSVHNKSSKTKKKRILVLGLFLWQVYIYLIASSGILLDFSFPPRFAMLLIIPSFIFTGFFLFINRKKVWIQLIPAKWLVFYQSFRILVESIFVATVAAGLLHKNVTIEGYNFDMIFGFTAPFIGWYVYKSKSYRKALLKFWNYFGLVVISVIIFLFITNIYLPELYGSDVSLIPTEITLYPYILIAGFLMPSAVFIHVLSLVQLSSVESIKT